MAGCPKDSPCTLSLFSFPPARSCYVSICQRVSSVGEPRGKVRVASFVLANEAACTHGLSCCCCGDLAKPSCFIYI